MLRFHASGVLVLLLSLLAFSWPVSAEPRLAPDARIPPQSPQPPALSGDDFARLALVASGADDAAVGTLLARLQSLSSDLKASLPAGADDRAKAEAVLDLMFKKVLTRYSEFQTRLDTALLSGEYNCVSSAILFYYLAGTIGLKVEGVETPDHAFCTVGVGGTKVDVETTNPWGFDPGSRKELPAAQAAQKRWVLVPQTKYRNRNAVGERRLLALVYNNRISRLERQGDFEQAVALAVDAWQLQNGAIPLKDLADRFLNYAIHLSNGGAGAEGLAFIQEVSARWGEYPGYRDYAASTVGKMLNQLMAGNDYPLAFSTLAGYEARMDPDRYREMRRGVAFNYLQVTVGSAPLLESLRKIASYREDLGSGDREKLVVYAYSREAERVGLGGKWLEAAAVLDEGLRELPGQGDMARQRSLYRQNYAIGVHNRAAAAYNAGDRETVKTLLAEGLRLVPESALLKDDLSLLK